MIINIDGRLTMQQVMCKQCLAVKNVPPGVNPHSLTWCDCCKQDHHHGENVLSDADCVTANHPGQACWNPPFQPVRPDGCSICRPIVVLAQTGDLTLTAG